MYQKILILFQQEHNSMMTIFTTCKKGRLLLRWFTRLQKILTRLFKDIILCSKSIKYNCKLKTIAENIFSLELISDDLVEASDFRFIIMNRINDDETEN